MLRIPIVKLPEIKFPGRADWHFTNVPDEELAACVYWEYARESKLKELGPRVNLNQHTNFTRVTRRLVEAILSTEKPEEAKTPEDGASTLTDYEGFFQEKDAWQQLSDSTKSRFYKLFQEPFVWASDDYVLSRQMLELARGGDDATNASKPLMILLTEDSLETCSDKILLGEFKKILNKYRSSEYPSDQASPLKGLFGSGIKQVTLRAYLSQLGAYRLIKDNEVQCLVDVFTSSDHLFGLVHPTGGQETWNAPTTWSKAKTRVNERLSQWFPFS